MRLAILLSAAALVLSACSAPAEIEARDGYVRLAAVKGRPAAAYFTLHGGAADATLMSVDSTVAIKSEMHESMKAGAGMTMKPIQDLPLPAQGTLAFTPGGKHVMLFDVNPGIKPGSVVPLTFTFTSGQRVSYKARAIGAGDPAPEF
ncbi:copper chaperone PCu(A)C [Sphingomonas sp.]|uniref:copper chaperone PCu(A)C n=1 Tax=Sphingomonas sp. TaxID=28214 RepID=UPI003D6D1C9D